MKRIRKLALAFGLLLLVLLLAGCKCEHEYGAWTVTKAATCTEEGSEQQSCKKCGETQERPLAKIEHIYGEWATTKEPTCTETGVATQNCSVCGATQETSIQQTEHTYDTWKVTSQATCSESGTKTRACSTCNTIETMTIEATGHKWKSATCTDPQICSVCKETSGSANGHKWKAATCESAKKCSACGLTEGKALGHCDVNGICSRCGKNMGDWIVAYYVDEFKQSTDDPYLKTRNGIQGTFSNSATTNSELLAQILVDDSNVCIMLYEYGHMRVKNYSSLYSDKYDIKLKTDGGKISTLSGRIYPGGDRIVIDDKYKSTVISALRSSKSVSFYIEESDRSICNYLFTIESSNFSEAYEKIK